jgi:hypothetical protein
MPKHRKPAIAVAFTTRPRDALMRFNSAEVVVADYLPKVQSAFKGIGEELAPRKRFLNV